MIKFFRKLRWSSLSRKRIPKYIAYATGEIVLVVIGILIALQINNWNEQTKKQELGIDYLRQLQQDLTLDAQLYEEQISNLSRQLEQVDSIVTILEKPDASINTIMTILENGVGVDGALYDNYDINNNTFLALQNSGNMNLIKKSVYDQVLDLNRSQKHYVRIIRDNSLYLQNVVMEAQKAIPRGGGSLLREQLLQTVDWPQFSLNLINALYLNKGVNERHIKVTSDILDQTNALNELIINEIENE